MSGVAAAEAAKRKPRHGRPGRGSRTRRRASRALRIKSLEDGAGHQSRGFLNHVQGAVGSDWMNRVFEEVGSRFEPWEVQDHERRACRDVRPCDLARFVAVLVRTNQERVLEPIVSRFEPCLHRDRRRAVRDDREAVSSEADSGFPEQRTVRDRTRWAAGVIVEAGPVAAGSGEETPGWFRNATNSKAMAAVAITAATVITAIRGSPRGSSRSGNRDPSSNLRRIASRSGSVRSSSASW